ncbi:MAG: class I tRNA ligase family protein [Thiotrichaceae bacterium]
MQPLRCNLTIITRPIPQKVQLFANYIYESLLQQGHVTKRTIRQAYDPRSKHIFLPDPLHSRHCPRCGAKINMATIVKPAEPPT